MNARAAMQSCKIGIRFVGPSFLISLCGLSLEISVPTPYIAVEKGGGKKQASAIPDFGARTTLWPPGHPAHDVNVMADVGSWRNLGISLISWDSV